MEIMCCLNEIGIMICKLKDGKKLNHCDKKVKDLHSYLKRKKKSSSKTMRKSIKSKSISDVFSMPDEPLLDDIDKSIPSPTPSIHSMPRSTSHSTSRSTSHSTSHSTPRSTQYSISSPSVNSLSESQSKYSMASGPSEIHTNKTLQSNIEKLQPNIEKLQPNNYDMPKYKSLKLDN